MRRTAILSILVAFGSFQALSAEEYELNTAAFHMNARGMALGGLTCPLDAAPERLLEVTFLIPFQLQALSIRKMNVRHNAFGLSWSWGWYQSGDADWMENGLSMHLEKQLNAHLHLGVQADVLFTIDALDATASTCFAEIDCRYDLSDNLTLGICWMNPSGAQLHSANGNVQLSSAALVGVRYAPAKKCLTYAEWEVELNQSLRGNMGVEYVLSEAFVLQTGFSTSPLMPSWGIGGKLKKFGYSWAGNLHPILGFSNGFSLRYSW